MNKKLILMCGIPASGKSTFISKHKEYFGETVKVVSRDAIRFSLLKEGDDYFSKENATWSIFVSEIKEGLASVEVTIADATHLNKASRLKIIRALGSSLRDIDVIPIVFDMGYDIAVAQNESRLGTRAYVPPTVIRNMANRFTIPTFDEYDYKTIYIYKPEQKIIIRERD